MFNIARYRRTDVFLYQNNFHYMNYILCTRMRLLLLKLVTVSVELK